MAQRRRRTTTTSAFGVGRRESHDASPFYTRFDVPAISDDDEIRRPAARDAVWCGDARDMDRYGDIADKSVALVVTSPPYFAGKEYEAAVGEGHVPADYAAYLEMLHAVFAECWRKLEPGGRIAVNVANLGRKPYRSLAGDVIGILETLGYLLRGEIIWQKAHAAGGSCAWGTYQRPGNPVLRDLTERVVVASKARFDRALSAEQRLAEGWPCEGSMTMDDFIDSTTDVWDLPAESATRVGHPAPFPIELPRRLIELYTYRGDLILDPFMGSGSTAVAALLTERSFAGFDTDPDYVERAGARIAETRLALDRKGGQLPRVVVSARRDRGATGDDVVESARREGQKASELAARLLLSCGFTDIRRNVTFAVLGVDVAFTGRDRLGGLWLFDLCGAFSSTRPGLRRGETLWRTLGRASVLDAARRRSPSPADLGPLVLLTTDLPPPRSAGARALQAVIGDDAPIFDVVRLFDDEALERLRVMGSGAATGR